MTGSSFFWTVCEMTEPSGWPRWLRKVVRYTLPFSLVPYIAACVGLVSAGILGGLLIGSCISFPNEIRAYFDETTP